MSTSIGKCREVCPVDIPLPTLLRGWREKSWREGLEPVSARWGIGPWSRLISRPLAYRRAVSAANWALRQIGKRWLQTIPLGGGWTRHRDFPAPQSSASFVERYSKGER